MSERASGHDGDLTGQVDRLRDYLSRNPVIAEILQKAPSLALAGTWAQDASRRRYGISCMVSKPPSSSRITIWFITTHPTSRWKRKRATWPVQTNSSPTCMPR